MLKDKLISGVICEFNPLHNGHKYVLDKIKSETNGFIICVMSGNFVQRGECAIIDKYSRTKMALLCGADLVIELPVSYAVSTAEKFAEGGVSIIDAVGCCDRLYFGSETGDSKPLNMLADYLLSENFSSAISSEIRNGDNFASTREAVIRKSLGNDLADLLSNPNDILGIEYIKALKKYDSSVDAYAVQRIGSSHDGTAVGNISSAMNIRNSLDNGIQIAHLMPQCTSEILSKAIESGNAPAKLLNCERAILAKLRTAKVSDFIDTPDVAEGIENKIITAAQNAKSLEELYFMIKSKRYSLARIRRIILNFFLEIKKQSISIPYIRVLGMNNNGIEIIKAKTNTLPYVLNYSDAVKLGQDAVTAYRAEALADDLYALMQPQISAGGKYYTTPIMKL